VKYYENKNNIVTKKEIKTNFFIGKNNETFIVSGEISNSQTVSNDSNLYNNNSNNETEQSNAFLGVFLKDQLILTDEDSTKKIEGLFNKMNKETLELFSKKYSESFQEVLFSFNIPKSNFFANCRKKITEKESRIHIFGDMFKFDYHYISSSDMEKIMKRCVDRRHPSNKEDESIFYVCLEYFFQDEYEIVNYMKILKNYYNEILSKNVGLEEPEIQKLINSKFIEIATSFAEKCPYFSKNNENIDPSSERDMEVIVENLRRFFCLGCFVSKEKSTPAYAMTVIDEKDEIKILLANSFVIDKIIKEYEKMGGDKIHGSLEYFFVNYDFVVKEEKNGREKELSVKSVPTKYADLEGEILVPSIRYWLMTVCLDILAYLNRFNDKITNYFNIKNTYSPIEIISLKENKMTFRAIVSEKPYITFEYNVPEIEKESDFNVEFLEI